MHRYLQQNEMLAYCAAKNIVVQAYSPLGNLKHPGSEDVTPLNEPIVAEIAKKLGKSPAQVILRWGIQHTGVVLPKSTTPSRIAENLALFDFELSAEQMKQMAELGQRQQRFVNPAIRPDGSKIFA